MTHDEWDSRLVTELDHWLRQERTAQAQQVRVVKLLRSQGCPWSVIGVALGLTKQAAQQRFSRRLEAPSSTKGRPSAT